MKNREKYEFIQKFAIIGRNALGVGILVLSSKHKSVYCEFYDRRTHRCIVDGTSWCAFPTSNYCDLALGEQGRRDSVPTVIRALLEMSYPKQEAPILPKLALRKIGAN